jgi:SAM-dependent methyltransferase
MSGSSEFFDAEASRYDAAYDADDWGGRFVRTRMDAVLVSLGAGPGRVLDAGMGGGRLIAELEQRGWTATGIDNSARMVALAVRRLPELAERLHEADLTALPLTDDSFDAVVATGVIEYVPDPQLALAELARVLRPGGKAVISFPNYRSPHTLWRRFVLYPAARLVKRVLPLPRPAPMRPLHPLTARAFEWELEAAGLHVVARTALASRYGGDPRVAVLIAPQLLFEVRA